MRFWHIASFASTHHFGRWRFFEQVSSRMSASDAMDGSSDRKVDIALTSRNVR